MLFEDVVWCRLYSARLNSFRFSLCLRTMSFALRPWITCATASDAQQIHTTLLYTPAFTCYYSWRTRLFSVPFMSVNDRIWWKQLARRKWNAMRFVSDSRTRIFMPLRMSEMLYVHRYASYLRYSFVVVSRIFHSQGVILNWIVIYVYG